MVVEKKRRGQEAGEREEDSLRQRGEERRGEERKRRRERRSGCPWILADRRPPAVNDLTTLLYPAPLRSLPSLRFASPHLTSPRCDGERLKKESLRWRSSGMRRRNEETRGIYSTAVTLLRIMLPRCATVIAQHGVS
ncbi:hypothetical protein ALC56_08868 [Trachymyrmex septentrionalis]|uniref:Uncharacterized protein n=1 Tax=Trachymyrmex septentrionalis TaxID=34720 RepID=A0A195FA39_9HYME|nr:hypothetical protein ALC56_08868 [Trachymyrmex septentrionalis]